jgi:hypothetical protein
MKNYNKRSIYGRAIYNCIASVPVMYEDKLKH